MNEQINKPLLILNASAGSGKTYNLVYQYLKIILKSDHSFQDFRHILAMTFTNKAANEMKERVIKALDNIARSTLQLPVEEAVSIFEKLENDLQVDRSTLIQRAQKSLRSLLHAYEDFHIMTIDKFNLKLIRNFSRDLDLPGQFDVEMNTDRLIEKLVDNLLNKIGEKDLEQLTEMVFSFAKSNLDDGEKWNVKNILVEFAKVLTKESVFPQIWKITEKSYDILNFKELNETRIQLNKELKLKANKVYQLVIDLGMTADKVPYKDTAFNQLIELKKTKSFLDGRKISASYGNYMLAEPKKDHYLPHEFQTALADYLTFYDENVNDFNILHLVVKNFHSMALLKFMSIFLEEIKQQDQIIQISEFNKLISDLIQKSHAPYIYERIGTKFNHYLLDEFQDTSRMQWLNLIPLVEESLAGNNLNFIVGDPKQSIYRFRNGVAEQFVALPEIYNPDQLPELSTKSDYFRSQGEVKPLLENRRSAKEIVKFNNHFFEELKLKLSPEAQAFYNPVNQIPTSKSEGFVSIVSAKEKITLDEQVDKIVEIIYKCDEAKFKRSEICILGERNKELNKWAVELLNRGIHVVSSDSLFINNDPRVRLTVSYLKKRLDPKNSTESKKFADLFFRIKKDKTQEDYWKYFVEKESNGTTVRYFDDIAFVNDNFNSVADFYFQYETIYSLVQQFYRLMGWYEEQNAYLHHLADVVYTFEQNNASDLKGFIDFYKKESDKMTVLLPESENSIQIMSIHKAKGLEFPVVIIPNLDFDRSVRGFSKYLIEIDDNIVYTNLKKDSPIKEISYAREVESNQILTDKVNLCYVALTRARERLYAFNFFQSSNLGSDIHAVLQEIEQDKSDVLFIQKGVESNNPKADEKSRKASFFEPAIVSDNLWFPEIAIRQDELENELSEEQKFGNAFHLVMSKCNFEEEIEKVVEQLFKEDLIPIDFKNELIEKSHKAFQILVSQGIFEGITKTMNETSIIAAVDSIKRPDKIIFKDSETIIVDFKTGLQKEKDVKQILEYAAALQSMNLPQVRSFLFYTGTDELKEIAC